MGSKAQAVIVTGASKGIGRACVLRLAQAGFRVYAGVRSSHDDASLRAESAAIRPVRIDITEQETIAAAASLIRAELGDLPLAGLVNNAGISVAAPLEFLPLSELRRQFEINVVGQVAMAQSMMPMLRAARGRIVNIGSIAGRSAFPFVGPYAASKFALEAITDSLRVELQPSGVDVIIIEPGAVATPIWQTSLAAAERLIADMPPEALEYYGGKISRVKQWAVRGGERGLPADAVARVVEMAITAKRPKTRYIVGGGARLRALIEMLPDRWRDRLIARRLSHD